MLGIFTFDGLRIKMDDKIFTISAVISVLAGFWAGVGAPLSGLIVLMALDILSGATASRAEGKSITSDAFSRGVAKKLVVLILLIAAWVVVVVARSYPALQAMPLDNVVAGGAVFFLIAELISIMENAQRMGIPLGPLGGLLRAAHAMTDHQREGNGGDRVRR